MGLLYWNEDCPRHEYSTQIPEGSQQPKHGSAAYGETVRGDPYKLTARGRERTKTRNTFRMISLSSGVSK